MRERAPRRVRFGDRVYTACVWTSALVITSAFACLVLDLVGNGRHGLSFGFLTRAPSDAGRAGGIGTVLVSTGLLLSVCLAVAVPLGLATALFLSEFARGRDGVGRFVRVSLDVLAGVPSIVFGLFGNAFFCQTLGLGFSLLAGGLTLACMVLPILIRSVELGLRAVPDDYRLAGAALDVSRARLIRRVLLPAAGPALLAGLLLGIGRALAETAALIFTSGYVERLPGSLLDSGRALSLHIYDLATNVAGGERNAYASALVLLLGLLAIHALSGWMVERFVSARVHRT